MYIPEKRQNHQISISDFNQSCGMELDSHNEWVKLADVIPWNKMEKKYASMFPSKTGHPATPFRMALGILIIQKRKKMSDRAVIKEIQENPYLQYFIGLDSFTYEQVVIAPLIVSFWKGLTAEYLMEANEYILAAAAPTAEHDAKKEAPVPRRPILHLMSWIILEHPYWIPHVRLPIFDIHRTILCSMKQERNWMQ